MFRNISAVGATLIFLIGAVAVHAQGRPATVGVDPVDRRTATETTIVFGEVVAGRESAVAARVGGLVQEVRVQVGDKVASGTILARVDTQLLEIDRKQALAQISIAEAGVEVAKSGQAQARRAFDRAERLAATSTIAEGQVQDRESELAGASGALAEAEARLLAALVALDRAEYNLRNAEIVAPFEGTVLSLATEVGQFITIGSRVATLLDDDNLEIEANVPARYIGGIRADSEVHARTDDGKSLKLRVRAILPTETAATRTRPVRFVSSGEGAEAVGASVTIDLPVSAPREVVTVSKDALVQARGGWSVFVNQDGKAVPRPVEVGDAVGDRLEVISGLEPGEVVVVRGNERLRPMQDIVPAGAGEPAEGAPARAATN